jgi:hypothetical protein
MQGRAAALPCIIYMKKSILVLGDLLAFLIITLIGFATHGEANVSFLPRMAAIFFPLVIAWFLLSPFLGLFKQEVAHNSRNLWRPALAMIFAAPFAAVLRGLLLNAPIIPIFAVVLSATSAFGIFVWRALYLIRSRKARHEGSEQSR